MTSATLSHTLERSIVIRAAARAWSSASSPTSARWAAWWGAGSTIDPRPGGRVFIRYPGGIEVSGESRRDRRTGAHRLHLRLSSRARRSRRAPRWSPSRSNASVPARECGCHTRSPRHRSATSTCRAGAISSRSSPMRWPTTQRRRCRRCRRSLVRGLVRARRRAARNAALEHTVAADVSMRDRFSAIEGACGSARAPRGRAPLHAGHDASPATGRCGSARAWPSPTGWRGMRPRDEERARHQRVHADARGDGSRR